MAVVARCDGLNITDGSIIAAYCDADFALLPSCKEARGLIDVVDEYDGVDIVGTSLPGFLAWQKSEIAKLERAAGWSPFGLKGE